MKSPLNFLRTEDGGIINVSQVQAFTLVAGEKYNGNSGNRHGYNVTAHFGPTVYNQSRLTLCFCDTHAEAIAELDRLFERLTGESADPEETCTVTDIAAPVRQWNGGPDPFSPDPINDSDRTTHTCGESACCLACEEEAFSRG